VSTTNDSMYYFKYPWKHLRHPFITNWTTNDIVVCTITSTVVFVTLVSAFSVWTLFAALMLWAFLNARFKWGRGYSVFYTEMKSVYIQWVLHDRLYIGNDEAETVSAIVRRFLREKRYRRPSRRFVFPVKTGGIELRDTFNNVVERIGTARELDGDKLIHLYIQAEGSDFSSFDPTRQHELVYELAGGLDDLAAAESLKISFSWTRLTRPVDLGPTDRYFAKSGQPVYFTPEFFDLNEAQILVAERMQKMYESIRLSLRQKGVADASQLLVVSIKPSKEMQNAANGKLDDKSLNELPIVKVGRKVLEVVATSGMNIQGARILDPDEVHHLFRASWDITDLSFHGQEASTYSAFPDDIEVGDDFIRMGRTYLSFLQVTGKPNKGFSVTGVQNLFHERMPLGTWTSVSTVGDAISGQTETTSLLIKEAAGIHGSRLFSGSNPIVEHPNIAKDRQARHDQTHELSDSSVALQCNDFVAVAGPSYDAMKETRELLKGRFSRAKFTCCQVRGRARQMDASITAVLCINRL
jgi:hypothetical protein